jgi:hypothetical protein
MKPWYRIFLYPLTLPADLLGWILLAIINAAWGQGIKWENGVMTVRLREDSWLQKGWMKYNLAGETVGHACLFTFDAVPGDAVSTHELIHVTQIETNCLAGSILCLVLVWFTPWWLVLITWMFFPGLIYIAASLVSLLQGKSLYRGNSLEEAARAGSGEEV